MDRSCGSAIFCILLLRAKVIFCRNRHYLIEQGQYFLISPDVLTFYRVDSKDPWNYAWICFNGTKASDILQALRNTDIGSCQKLSKDSGDENSYNEYDEAL